MVMLKRNEKRESKIIPLLLRPEEKEEITHRLDFEGEKTAPNLHAYLVVAKMGKQSRVRLVLMPGRKEDIIGRELPNEVVKNGVILFAPGDKWMCTLLGWVNFIPRNYGLSPEDLGLDPGRESYKIPVVLLVSTIKMARMWIYIASLYNIVQQGKLIEAERNYYAMNTMFLAHRVRALLEELRSVKEALLNAEYNIISAAERFGALLYRKHAELITSGVTIEKSWKDILGDYSKILMYGGIIIFLVIVLILSAKAKGLI